LESVLRHPSMDRASGLALERNHTSLSGLHDVAKALVAHTSLTNCAARYFVTESNAAERWRDDPFLLRHFPRRLVRDDAPAFDTLPWQSQTRTRILERRAATLFRYAWQ